MLARVTLDYRRFVNRDFPPVTAAARTAGRVASVIPRDTSATARAAQIAALRRLTPPDRVALALELSDEVRELVASGVRERHPEYSRRQVDDAVRRIFLGPELDDRIVGRR